MIARTNWVVVAMAIVCIVIGVAFSHRMEPGVRVERVTLAENIPALKFLPPNPGPHPIVLLAHGVTASKETLFRLGEALAAAGFQCFAVDLPGHGESRQSFMLHDNVSTLEKVTREIGPVDIFVGHSMGAGAGNGAVTDGGLNPKLFIALGAIPYFGEHGPPLLLLDGKFEELIRPEWLKEQTNATLVISPWSDHALEPYDPVLVNAAVKAACAAVGQTPPAAPTAWLWRLAGLTLGMAGALGLVFCLPEVEPWFAKMRGLCVPAALITVFVLTSGTWLGSAPQLPRIPLQLIMMTIVWLPLAGMGKLGWPRWIIPALSAVIALGCVLLAVLTAFFHLLAMLVVIMAALVCAGAAVGWLADRRASRRQGDIAMAIFIGYAIGQWTLKIL